MHHIITHFHLIVWFSRNYWVKRPEEKFIRSTLIIIPALRPVLLFRENFRVDYLSRRKILLFYSKNLPALTPEQTFLSFFLSICLEKPEFRFLNPKLPPPSLSLLFPFTFEIVTVPELCQRYFLNRAQKRNGAENISKILRITKIVFFFFNCHPVAPFSFLAD